MGRREFIANKLSETFDLPRETVEGVLKKYNDEVSRFIESKEPGALVWLYQDNAEQIHHAQLPSLFVADINSCVIQSKGLGFVHTGNTNKDISCMELLPHMTGTILKSLLNDIFTPIVESQPPSSRMDILSKAAGALSSIVNDTHTDQGAPNDHVAAPQGSVVLRQPDAQLATQINNTDAFEHQENDALASGIESLLEDWRHDVHVVLHKYQNGIKISEDAGKNNNKINNDNSNADLTAGCLTLDDELQQWKSKAAVLNHLSLQLQQHQTSRVYLVASILAPKSLKRLKISEGDLAKQLDQAKECIAALSALIPVLRPLLLPSHSSSDIASSPSSMVLTRVFAELRLAVASVQIYSDPRMLSKLVACIARQMAARAKEIVVQSGTKVWEQPQKKLIDTIDALTTTYSEFQTLARDLFTGLPSISDDTRVRVGQCSSCNYSSQSDVLFADAALSSYTATIRRCKKIRCIAQISARFAWLGQHSYIPVLKESVESFHELFEIIKKQHPFPLDSILMANSLEFDKDVLDFETHVNDLELAIESTLKESFRNATSTEHALSLIHRYACLFTPDVLDSEIDAMYAEAFQKFGNDIESVQTLYEKQKSDPPIPRGSPPISGAIMWSRGLLQKIERPMRQFSMRESFMASKESKKIIKSYNRLAQTLLEFEALWYAAWICSADTILSQLQVPVLLLHPKTNMLHVNLDASVLVMLREGQWMGRMGLNIPESVKKALLLSDCLVSHHAQLSGLVSKIEKARSELPIALQSMLLKPHTSILLRAAQAGMSTVCWTSATLDGYIAQFGHVIDRSLELMHRCADIHTHRVAAIVSSIARLPLVQMTLPNSPSCEEFLKHQLDYITQQTALILQKDGEIKSACEDVIQLATNSLQSKQSITHALHIDPKACEAYRYSCFSSVRNAVGVAVSAALHVVTNALCAHGKASCIRCDSSTLWCGDVSAPLTPNLTIEQQQSNACSPVFSLEMHLESSDIALHPSVEEAQMMFVECARNIAGVIDVLPLWLSSTITPTATAAAAAVTTTTTTPTTKPESVDLASAIQSLEFAFENMHDTIQSHISIFEPYSFLWKTDKTAMCDVIMHEKPSVEEYESQLRRFDVLHRNLDELPIVFDVQGVVSLIADPLKHALHAAITAWKTEFSYALHERAKSDLGLLDRCLKQLVLKLAHRIENLQDLAAVVDALDDARNSHFEYEKQYAAIQEMFTLLMRYNIDVPKEEKDALSAVRYAIQTVQHGITEASSRVEGVQGVFLDEVKSTAAILVAESAQFRALWDSEGPLVPGLVPSEATLRLAKFKVDFEPFKRKWEKLVAGETLFRIAETPLPLLQQIQDDIVGLEQLYGLYNAVLQAIKDRGALPWTKAVEEFDNLAAQIVDFQVQGRKMPKTYREWQAYKDCRKTIEDLSAVMPLLQGLSHKSMKDRHWQEVARITHATIPLPSEGLLLGHLLEANLLAHREEIEDITSAVMKEEAVERKLRVVLDQWALESFTFADHKQRGQVILKPAETAELLERLEDSTMVLGSLSASRYSAPFRAELQSLATKLSAVDEALERWLAVQAMWSYMEAVFSGGDIVKQLPEEANRFQTIDKSFMKMIEHAKATSRVVETCTGSDQLKTLLPHLLEQLEVCQKSLAAYLETKRAEFPRFCFVSDPTLLEILSLGSDPSSVVPHFQSGLFDSLSNVTFDPTDKYKITEMWSREGEQVPLIKHVDARGSVETWLQRLVVGMQETIRSQIRKAVSDVNTQPLAEFIFSRPAQIALLGLQLKWTSDTLAGLQAASRNEKGALTKALKKAESTMHDLVALALRGDLTRMQRTSLETCITVYMHQKEATEELVRKRVRDPRDFEWLKQCRFTWREDRETVITSICDVDLEYSYEYLGVKERLVITPLTDICYITLTQALGMFLGGAPAGPAGTGKTETTKDLGATLGKYVVVFNCSDQMDHKGMGKIFKGLAQSGLWGCFDEFNRINLDVLSVCAQQVNSVFSAVRERRKTFTFTDGSVLPLDPRVGIFITMNPGYAGRQELPENLKAMFRGVTMMVPNRQIIMKVKLAAAGYQDNDALAKKFNVLYALCEQQLSKQPHYDFGLRNILSVLRTAGTSKRANPTMSETELIMRTLRDMNMSKFVAEDVPLFLALLEDLFPGQRAERAPAVDVISALGRVCKDRGLQPHPSWIDKCVQLYETALVRHGIMVVGPPGSGKSSAIECLAAALTDIGQKTVVWRMNPKSITAPQMFGRMDAATGDWTDGIFAALWRRAAKAPKGQTTWIVLDGPVDAVWIENLNTVLDDNKVLTLANGDRVLMTSSMRLIFEPENLNNASPATVSRAGIIYFSDSELGWQPVIDSWLNTRPERESSVLRPCFEKFVGPVLGFLKTECKLVMKCEAVCLVNTLLTLLNGVVGPSTKGGSLDPSMIHALPQHQQSVQSDQSTASMGDGNNTKNTANSNSDNNNNNNSSTTDTCVVQKLERSFLYCLAWSLGGLLNSNDRCKLDQYLRSLSHSMPPLPSNNTMTTTSNDNLNTIFEYFVDDISGEWQHWSSQIPEWKFPDQPSSFTQMVVPTLDSIRYEKLISLVHNAGKSTLLVGGPGTAKTTIIKQFLSRFDPDFHTSKTITFSTLTTPSICQSSLENSVEKRQGRTFGPPGGKKSTIFLDDLSMPAINNWGDQVTNELVRQVLEQGGFYSTEKPIGEFKQLVDISYVAAMSLPGSGRTDIPNRLKRQFCIFHLPPPSTASITGVFGTLMAGHFSSAQCYSAVSQLAQRLVPATIHLWSAVQNKMLPTPAKFHYIFTMRDISKVFQGVMQAQKNVFYTTAGADGADNAVKILLALWMHECRRVFTDKLISPDEKSWVDATLAQICKDFFNFGEELIGSSATYFADFLRSAPIDESTGEPLGPRPSCYELAPGGLIGLKSRVEELISIAKQQCRPGEGPPELVLFDDAMEHVLRVSRILCIERGSALLVGVGGSGKQSLARLAAFLAGASCFKITLTKTYGVSNLLEDLKSLYKQAAFKPSPVVFLVTETDIKDDAFLEYINQVLMTGEVAGLFSREEQDGLLNDLRPIMRSERPGVPDTFDNLYSFFIGRVRARLHVVLCISPVGSRFARWAQQFPGIINGCTIDWFLPWPQEALLSVSSKLLSNTNELSSLPLAHLSALHSLMALVHTRITAACQQYYLQYRRHVHVTPKSYIASIEGFKALYNQKRNHLRALATSLATGLQKMNTAKEDVGRMKLELIAKNENLAVAGAEAEKLLKEISESTAAAEKERSKVAVIVEGVRKKAEEIAAVKSEAESDLQAAQPALEAALAALNSIAPKDIVALKALKSPPDVIKRIMDSVLLLRHYPVNKVTWQDVKGSKVLISSYEESVKMMSDMNFLQALLTFPKDSINDETVELLQPYFAAPDFNYEAAKKASGSVAGLCNWAESMCKYHQVAKAVEPKIIKLRAAEGELRVAEAEKKAAEGELALVQARLNEMQAKLDAAVAHKAALEADAAATQRKMDNAIALMSALGGEEARWNEQVSGLDVAMYRLVGDCAVASTFISYLGPFNRQFREQLLSDVIALCTSANIPLTPDLNTSSFLADDPEIGQWAIEGLPTDSLSVQNGVLVTRATRCPLLIDPQGQGRSWLMKKEGAAGLKVVQLTEKHFRSVLEESITLGRPVLIENIDEDFDPVLDALLERKFIKKGKSIVVVLGDKEVDVNDGFRLYMTSRLPNPKWSPETFAKVAVIDFTVTQSGLEDQLLGILVLKEKKELEEQRRRLVEEVQGCRQRIAKLEEDLLFRLSSSTGNLIDDTTLVDVLALTKTTSTEVKERMHVASETRQRITAACEEYRPAAQCAMLLYFLVAEFSSVNVMYQTSLAQFTMLYNASIDAAAKSPIASQRVSSISEHLTACVYDYVQRGLFQRHKLVFAFMMAQKIAINAGTVSSIEMDIFLKLGTGVESSTGKKKPKEWIPSIVWKNILLLADKIPHAFSALPDAVIKDDANWHSWFDCETPEASPCPQFQLSKALTPFQKVCLLRAFREDRVLLAVAQYVAETLGSRFIESLPANPEQSWESSSNTCPIICLLSPGADPTKSIEELAKRKKIKCFGVSMGQGQEVFARRLVSSAATEGHWVLLQNTHLGLSYLHEIEQFFAKSDAASLHSNFRVWITSEPHPQFPIGLLHIGLKLTNEAPVGVRAGLRASYQWLNQDVLDAVPRQEWRQLLFALCFLHSVVQERRKFGPIGWNVPYEFNAGDLAACVQFLQNHMLDVASRRASAPDWSTMQYMMSTIQYGGRITDDRDRAIMDAYANKFFHESVVVPGYHIFDQYSIPDTNDIEVYRKTIEAFPLQDSPELFGLHSNADLTCRSLQVAELISVVSDLQPKGVVNVGSGNSTTSISKEESVEKTCESLLNKLPAVLGADEVKHSLQSLPGGPTLPLNIHLRQEIERLGKVIVLVADTLKTLRLAVAGVIALSDDILAVMDAVHAGRVPSAWLKSSWESPSLNSWFQGLLQRYDQLHRWLTTGRPKSFWFPGFFNPQGFLTAIKQEVTRHHASGDAWELDDVVLVSEVTKFADGNSVRESSGEGVFIHGLSLEGCSWSTKQGKMADPEPKKLFSPLPVMHVTAVRLKDKKKDGYFEIPCYKVKRRTGANYIANFMLKTDEENRKWILRGAAALCSIE